MIGSDIHLTVEAARHPWVLCRLGRDGRREQLVSFNVALTNETLAGFRSLDDGDAEGTLERAFDAANLAMIRGDYSKAAVHLLGLWLHEMNVDLPRIAAEGRTGVVLAEYSAAMGAWLFHHGVADKGRKMGWTFDASELPPDTLMPADGHLPRRT